MLATMSRHGEPAGVYTFRPGSNSASSAKLGTARSQLEIRSWAEGRGSSGRRGRIQIHYPTTTSAAPSANSTSVRCSAYSPTHRCTSFSYPPRGTTQLNGPVSEAGWRGVPGPACGDICVRVCGMRGSTALVLAGVGALGYKLTVEGSLTLDTGWGRRMRPLGCPAVDVVAPRDVVFDVLAAPYGERRPRALAEKVEVLERGNDMVLAAHRTQLGGRRVATTVETVRFTSPARIDFRLVRGPSATCGGVLPSY